MPKKDVLLEIPPNLRTKIVENATNLPMPNYSTMKKKKQNTTKGTIGIDVRQSHQLGFRQANPKRKKKQLAPLDMKQKECTCITEVEENPNGKQ